MPILSRYGPGLHLCMYRIDELYGTVLFQRSCRHGDASLASKRYHDVLPILTFAAFKAPPGASGCSCSTRPCRTCKALVKSCPRPHHIGLQSPMLRRGL